MYWESDTQEVEKDIFYFVGDTNLRTNLAYTLQHCYWLIYQKDQAENTDRASLICRDIIIHFGAIVENLIFYTLSEYHNLGNFDGKIAEGNEWKAIQSVPVEGELNKFLGIFTKKKHTIIFNEQTSFQDLNKIAKKLKIFNKYLYNQSELIRKERNELHCKVQYEKEDIKEVFKASKEIKNVLIQSLEDIRS